MRLPDPPTTARSIITIVSADGRISGQAHDVSDAIHFEASGDKVELLFYEESLSRLGLARGALVSAQGRDCALTQPVEVQTASLDGAGHFEARSLDPKSLDFLIPDREPRCSQCPRLSVEKLVLERPGVRVSPIASAWFSDQSVVVSVAQGGLYFADRQATRRIPGCDKQYYGLTEAGERRFWAGSRGSLDLLEVSEAADECHTLSSTTSPAMAGCAAEETKDCQLALLVHSASDPSTVWVGAPDGALYEKTDAHFVFLGRVAPSSFSEPNLGGIVVLPDDRVMFAPGSGEIGFYSPVTQELVAFEPTFLNGIDPTVTELTDCGDLGICLGTGTGGIAVYKDSGFRELRSPLVDDVDSLGAFRGNVLVGTTGQVQIVHSEGVCDPIELPGGNGKFRTILTRDDLVFIADFQEGVSGSNSSVGWLLPD